MERTCMALGSRTPTRKSLKSFNATGTLPSHTPNQTSYWEPETAGVVPVLEHSQESSAGSIKAVCSVEAIRSSYRASAAWDAPRPLVLRILTRESTPAHLGSVRHCIDLPPATGELLCQYLTRTIAEGSRIRALLSEIVATRVRRIYLYQPNAPFEGLLMFIDAITNLLSEGPLREIGSVTGQQNPR